jgi:hypothetical protein
MPTEANIILPDYFFGGAGEKNVPQMAALYI